MSVSELCKLCAKEDLSKLFNDPPAPEPGYSLKDYEEKCTTWLQRGFEDVVDSKFSFSCALCKLIRECAYRADIWKKAGVACSIRPVFAWRSSDSVDAAPIPTYSGGWHVWFYEVKLERKTGPPPNPSGQPNMSRTDRMRSIFRRSKIQKAINEPGFDPVDDFEVDISQALNSTRLTGDSSTTRSSSQRASRRSEGLVPVNKAIASWTVEAVKLKTMDTTIQVARDEYRVPVNRNIDFNLARHWIRECDTKHAHDNTRDLARQRLHRAYTSNIMRAINTETSMISLLPPDAKYVALSYVWGKVSIPVRLRNAPYPSTIIDALHLARKLGFNWLWVDRLCINQDDEAEKLALVPVIKDIFALAEITIVAAASDGAHNKLPGVVSERDTHEDLVTLHHGSAALSLLPAPYSFNRLLEPCSWRKRGWTFEEHVFSQRLLYVFDTEVVFSCAKGTYREAHGMRLREGSAGSTWGDHGSKLPTIEGLLHAKFNANCSESNQRITCKEFVKATEEYSGRNLTFEEDRIRAFAGLVTAPTSSSDPLEETSVLLHGHPLMYFETLLTWHGNESEHTINSSSPGKIAPSWSWAACGGKVYFHDDGEEHSRCNWFKFTLYEGFDILGVPIETDIPIVSDLGLGSYATLVQSVQPNSGLLPTYSTAIHQESGATPSRLPQLHLVTVTFQAVFLIGSDDKHCIHPQYDPQDHRSNARFIGQWNIDSVKHLPGVTRLVTFALVGGNSRMYIMLLEPGSERGIFQRDGLVRVPVGPFGTKSTRALTSIMSLGKAKWEHIVIA